MRGRFTGLLVALACVTATGLYAQNTMVFFASVADDKGAPVSTLAVDDLKVVENGVEGKIVKVEPIDWPVKVQMLIDNGTGMDSALVQIRNGVKGFVEALPDGIEMSLYTTAPQPRNIVRPTMDKQAMVQGADRIVPDSGAPRFIEALNEAAGRVDKDKGNYFPVVVILGSTTAEGSSFIERDVQRMLQRFAERSTVHVIMYSTGARWPRTRAAGMTISRPQTGWLPCCPRSVHRLQRATPVRAVNSASHFSVQTARRGRSGRSALKSAPG